MSKGFLTLAQNGKEDYVKMAYALALSLKLSQSKYNKLSVVVNNDETIPVKYLEVFDRVFYIDKPDESWKIQNKWQYYNITPYDETIVLDSDMLFFNDISSWWSELGIYNDIDFTTNISNYKGEVVTSDYYRKVFTNNKLPNLYTGLFYFKKTKEIKQYFKLVELIFKNWEVFYEKFLKDSPKHLSGDVVYSLAAKIMFNRKWDSYLSFTHMRSRLQDSTMVDNWNKYLPSFFTKHNGHIGLKVCNYNQTYPFHYIKKDFMNDEVIELYETTLRLL